MIDEEDIAKHKEALKAGDKLGLISTALAQLVENSYFDDECISLVARYKDSEEKLAFHYPLSELARAYLHLAGAETYKGSNETTLGLISEYGRQSALYRESSLRPPSKEITPRSVSPSR